MPEPSNPFPMGAWKPNFYLVADKFFNFAWEKDVWRAKLKKEVQTWISIELVDRNQRRGHRIITRKINNEKKN